ncbi:hypothetical protein M2427_006117 [Bradyrhizobium sp. BR13661]|jgi:hypothetical protein|nr:hypothetical protein [Bradyrhizobium sp. BR13661]
MRIWRDLSDYDGEMDRSDRIERLQPLDLQCVNTPSSWPSAQLRTGARTHNHRRRLGSDGLAPVRRNNIQLR